MYPASSLPLLLALRLQFEWGGIGSDMASMWRRCYRRPSLGMSSSRGGVVSDVAASI
jgi:hypothetical protein